MTERNEREITELLQAWRGGDEQVDQRKSQVVELRFFGGLSNEETAEVLKVSSRTVERDWILAKAWLLREIAGHGP
jgi:DNA-directed RNA polymerase specialized sigma24 family protein